MHQTPQKDLALGAIDVGTNAARLELVCAHPDGTFETLHYERAPIRPGEGVFESGNMADAVADRLVATLKHFAERCQRYEVQIRAVATSALRNASNAEAVLERVRTQAGIQLEVISGREEARLVCLGVCRGRPRAQRSLVLDIGGGSTEVALAQGGVPTELWSVPLGAVRLTGMFGSTGEVGHKKLALMRAHSRQMFTEAVAVTSADLPDSAFGSSGTVRALTGFASGGRAVKASLGEISAALEKIVAMSPAERLQRFSAQRADIIVAGAVILESLAASMGLRSITSVDRGLRHGILIDLQKRALVLPR